GVPTEILQWIKRRYAQRTTKLSFDDFISEPFRVEGGEDQGDPFAAIGYILYAADLMKILKVAAMERGLGLMDDVAAVTWARDF
ncbi:hypothetical protein F5890DRAFT_1387021, partial [Lentinula detonsa]